MLIALICISLATDAIASPVASDLNETFDLMDSGTNNSENYYNDSTLYQTDHYSTYYFSQLTTNYGWNIKGSCTYVALGMLLSYYDTYWNDNIIPESYDFITLLSDNELTLDVESPGIYRESSSVVQASMTTAEYYQAVEQYSNAYFHLKLIQMGKEQFMQYDFDTTSNPCGLTRAQLEDLIEYYLYDFMGFDATEISYTCCTSNVRQFVIDNITAGNPVLVRMGSTTVSGIGHAFILYDYDAASDELYGHFGWRSSAHNFEHVKLSSTPYDNFWDATVLVINTEHVCSNNYKYSDAYNATETFCPCVHSIHEAYHIHSYDGWQYLNSSLHIELCDCGATGSRTASHAIQGSEIVNNRANCMGCGFAVDLRFGSYDTILSNAQQVSINGSYIHSSGVIVLMEDDVEAYLNGTLVFYNASEIPEVS